jgi:hypothetical protein
LGRDGFPSAQRIACALSACFEFVHVAQYERLGKVGFFKNTFNKSPHTDIPDAPFELEAEAKAVKACRDAGVRPFSNLLGSSIRKLQSCAIAET